jgi:transposase-like protein
MRFTDEEKAMWLEDWKGSGQSAASYAKANGLNYQTFINWTRSAKQNGNGLVEITEKFSGGAAVGDEITIEAGVFLLHIPAGISGAALCGILKALRAAL